MPVAVLTLFMQRKWSVPRLMVIAIPVSSAASLFDFLSLLYLSQEALGPYLDTQPMIQDLMSALIAPAIWTPYFVGSVRVRTTFVGQPIASRSR